jgi:putative heme iron utilization protein
MNDDHGEAIVIYAQAFGGIQGVTSAQMLSIDAEGMNLTTQVNGSEVPVRIQFDHVLVNAEDAHHTMIAMLKQAKVKAN